MDEYTKKIISYLNNPQFDRILENPTHKAYFKGKVCGDINKIYLQIENNIIVDISYEHTGCAANIASLEILCSYLKGKHFDEIQKVSKELILNELEVPEHKKHCVDLVFETLEKIEHYI